MVEDVGLHQAFRTEIGQLFPGYKELFWERVPGCDMVLENASGLRKYIEFKGGNPSAPGRWLEEKQYQLAKEKGDDFVIVRWKDASRSGIKLAVGSAKALRLQRPRQSTYSDFARRPRAGRVRSRGRYAPGTVAVFRH